MYKGEIGCWQHKIKKIQETVAIETEKPKKKIDTKV
jgi:hypothetical protein